MAGHLMLQVLATHKGNPFRAGGWIFLGFLSATGLAVGITGVVHYGYIGQDFQLHRDLIVSFPRTFNYGLNDPPGLYWFGSLVRECVGPAHYLEAIALAFLALNASALWIFYRLLWASIAQWQLRCAAAALITLIPFRVIHSVVLAADAFTLPVFALTVLLSLRLFKDPRGVPCWIGLSLCLAAGILCKYTVVGLLPPLALLLGIALWRRLSGGDRLRWGAVAVAALLPPAAVFLLQMRASAGLKGPITNQQWLPHGSPPVMGWRDILVPKDRDMSLLERAPDYLRDRMYGAREYSYLGLLHASCFADILGYFQPPPEGVSTDWARRTQEPFQRGRTALSQELQTWSVRLCLPFSVLAVAGTLVCSLLCIQSAVSRNPRLPPAVVVMTALAAGFYLPILLSLHRLQDPYTPGFWLPRLVMPALLVFFSLGFVLLDLIYQRLGSRLPILAEGLSAFAGYTLVACALFVGFLC